MVVIIEKEVREIGCAVVAGLIATSVSPFASNRLNKAFGFAVGLRSVRFGEGVFDFEIAAGSGKVF